MTNTKGFLYLFLALNICGIKIEYVDCGIYDVHGTQYVDCKIVMFFV